LYYEGINIPKGIMMPFCFTKKEIVMKTKKELLNLVFAALFLAFAFVMPFLTGQIPEIGAMLCPMHIPVIICGFVCGWHYGLAVVFAAPILRSLILGMPPMFPTALCMAFELAAYGLLCGLLYKILPKKKLYIYVSLVTSMILGRLVWGVSMFMCLGFSGGTFTLGAFFAGAVVNALPGIITQLVLVPIVVMLLQNTKVLDSKNI
jgi:riboflavin transporter FmnP